MTRPISAWEDAARANHVYEDSAVGSTFMSWRRQALHGSEQNGFYSAVYHDDGRGRTVIAYGGSGGNAPA